MARPVEVAILCDMLAELATGSRENLAWLAPLQMRARGILAAAPSLRRDHSAAALPVLVPAEPAPVVPAGKPAKGKAKAKAPTVPAAPADKAAAFWAALEVARGAAGAALGAEWWCHPSTMMAKTPAPASASRSSYGTTIRAPQTFRMPAAEYWPGGELPAVKVSSVTKSAPSAWNQSGVCVGERVEQWAERTGLVRHRPTGTWQTLADAAELDARAAYLARYFAAKTNKDRAQLREQEAARLAGETKGVRRAA